MDKIYRYSIPLENYTSIVKLDINEYNFEHPPEFYITLFSTLLKSKTVTHYSNMFCDETIRLIKNIANITNLVDEHVILTSGSDTALEYIVTCLFNNDDTKLFYLTPNYSYMFDYLKKHKKNLVLPIEFDITKDNYKLSDYLDKYEDINNNHVFYISNPNNPTGLCIDKDDLKTCIIKYNKLHFIIDEAYIEFADKNESMCEFINSFPNLYIVRTFSKAYGIAGLRLGYILSQKQNIINIHNNAFNESSLTEISKCAGNYILENLNYYNKIINDIKANKLRFFNFLDDNDVYYIHSQANFVSIYIGKNTYEFTTNLQKIGIIVRNKTKDTNMYGFVRITIGTFQQMVQVCSYILECDNNHIERKSKFLLERK
jgi:histidinol-phosphate aminotransferase